MGEKVDVRVRILREAISRIEVIGRLPYSQFTKDPFILPAAERSFHVAIEALIDLGNILISELKLRTPDTYVDIFKILGEAGVLPSELVDEAISMVKFRNLLVHGYSRIDPSEIYHYSKEKPEVMKLIGKKLLEKLLSLDY